MEQYSRRKHHVDVLSSDTDTCNISRGASRMDINLDAPVTEARMTEKHKSE